MMSKLVDKHNGRWSLVCTLTACHFRELLLAELSGTFVLFAVSFPQQGEYKKRKSRTLQMAVWSVNFNSNWKGIFSSPHKPLSIACRVPKKGREHGSRVPWGPHHSHKVKLVTCSTALLNCACQEKINTDLLIFFSLPQVKHKSSDRNVLRRTRMMIQRFFSIEEKQSVFSVFTDIEIICRLVINPSSRLLEPGDMR